MWTWKLLRVYLTINIVAVLSLPRGQSLLLAGGHGCRDPFAYVCAIIYRENKTYASVKIRTYVHIRLENFEALSSPHHYNLTDHKSLNVWLYWAAVLKINTQKPDHPFRYHNIVHMCKYNGHVQMKRCKMLKTVWKRLWRTAQLTHIHGDNEVKLVHF